MWLKLCCVLCLWCTVYFFIFVDYNVKCLITVKSTVRINVLLLILLLSYSLGAWPRYLKLVHLNDRSDLIPQIHANNLYIKCIYIVTTFYSVSDKIWLNMNSFSLVFLNIVLFLKQNVCQASVAEPHYDHLWPWLGACCCSSDQITYENDNAHEKNPNYKLKKLSIFHLVAHW